MQVQINSSSSSRLQNARARSSAHEFCNSREFASRVLASRLATFRVVNGTMSDTRVARSPRASPDRTKKKAKGRHGGSRTGSGRKFAHDHTFNKCNLPELHEIDYDALVKIWKEGAKKRVGIFKGREAAVTKEQSLSKVVKRHLARTSSIPIFKKRDETISIYEAK